VFKKINSLINNIKKNRIGSLLYFSGVLLILYNIALASMHLFTQDFSFKMDIPRDFLLIDNAIQNHKIELIGPKAAGIPGIFFGPIWYWMMTPIFIIGKGDPTVIGAFWLFLVILLIGITYFIAKKIFGKEVAFISALLISFNAPTLALGFTQSFGSLLMSPFIFYSLYKFYISKNVKYFILAIFLMGITFHLQPAFTLLVVASSGLFFLYFLIKIKKIHYLLSYLILLIPLSTYIVFELRHKFLMTNAFYNFLFNHSTAVTKDENLTTSALLINRIIGFMSGFNFTHIYSNHIMIGILIAQIFIIYMLFRKKIRIGKEFYIMIYSIFILFWILSFLFKGFVWPYYYWAFLPIGAIIFSSIWNLINKKLFIILVSIICIYMLNNIWAPLNNWSNPALFSNPYADTSSWKLNRDAGKIMFDESESKFGYFVFSPDEIGLSIKYAIRYWQYRNTDKTATLCKKMETTYLFYYPDDPNSIADSYYWKEERIKIQKDPVQSFSLGIVKIEKYTLTPEEIQVAHDPNLLCTLIFR